MAEAEGFEPPVPCDTSVFKTGAFSRSATPPLVGGSLANGRWEANRWAGGSAFGGNRRFGHGTADYHVSRLRRSSVHAGS